MPTLHDKVMELYVKKDNPDITNIHRNIEKFLQKKYPAKKLQRIVDVLQDKHDLTEESLEIRCNNQLSTYIDSMIISRIRDSFKSSKSFEMDSLEEIKFRALIKQLIIHFGYEVLFIPENESNSVDLIVHRGDVKVAVLAVKSSPDDGVGVKVVRQLKSLANYYHCEEAILISSTIFDEDATQEALDLGITLIDKKKLLPLVQDLIDNRQQEEKKLLTSNSTDNKSTIVLDAFFKTPKTKVQVVFIKYFLDSVEKCLKFEGELFNNGKKPVSNLFVNIKVFNRDNNCVAHQNSLVTSEGLESKEKVDFSVLFNEILENDLRNICRYELKLEYSNVGSVAKIDQ